MWYIIVILFVCELGGAISLSEITVGCGIELNICNTICFRTSAKHTALFHCPVAGNSLIFKCASSLIIMCVLINLLTCNTLDLHGTTKKSKIIHCSVTREVSYICIYMHTYLKFGYIVFKRQSLYNACW